MTRTVVFKGNPLTLVGPELHVGDKAPECSLIDNEMNIVPLSSFRGKALLITSVPSLDTPACDIMTKEFNQAVEALHKSIQLLTVSMDLPFAQKRWCGAAHAQTVKTLSDYRGAPFGHAWGVFIKEWYLLARSVFIVDASGVIRYIEIVPEVSEQPNHQVIMEFVASLN